MTPVEAQAAAPILTHVFGDAEVRQSGSEPYDYFVRVYVRLRGGPQRPGETIDVPTADAAGRLIAERIKGA